MAGSEHASADDADDRVAVTAGGVHVSKWVTEEGSTVPIVKYEIRSVRDDDVRVALTDRVPDHLDLDDVGFHDEYHGDRWQHTDAHTIRFETEVPAGETLTTVYGVRREAIEDPDAFLSRPQMSISASKRREDADAVDANDGESSDGGDGKTEAATEDATDDDTTVGEKIVDDTTADEKIVDDTTADEKIVDDTTADENGETTVFKNGDASVDENEDASTVDTDDANADESAGEVGTLSLADPTDADASPEGNADEGDSSERPSSDGSDSDGDGEHAIPLASPNASAADSSGRAGERATDRENDSASGVAESESTSGASSDAAGDEAPTESTDVVASADAMPDAVLVERFVEALESGDVPADTKAALGRELNLQLSASSSQFVEHLQSRMKDKRSQLEGDLEGLEDSVAELYGVKADASTVAEMRTEMAKSAHVDDLANTVEDLGATKADETALAAVQDSLVDLEGKAATEAALEAEAGALASEIGNVQAELHALDDRAATESDLDAVAEDVEDLDAATPTLEAFESLREDVEALSDAAAREEDLDALAEDLADARETFESELDALEDLFTDRLDSEVAALEGSLASLNDEKADVADLEAEHERVETLSRTKADAERLGDVEAALDERYVTEADITDALEARLERSLFARTVLVVGGAFAGGGIALAATGVTAGVALLLAGVAAIGYWWYVNEKELVETANPGVLASSEREVAGDNAGGVDAGGHAGDDAGDADSAVAE